MIGETCYSCARPRVLALRRPSLSFAIAKIVLTIFLAADANAAEIIIAGHAADSIVPGSTTTISGTVRPPGLGILQIWLGGKAYPAKMSGDNWTLALSLPERTNLVRITYGGESLDTLLTVSAGIGARPQQKVQIIWEEGSDAELKKIAQRTLSLQQTEAVLDHFVEAVKVRTVQALLAMYKDVGNIAISDVDGPDVHRIHMRPTDIGAFGQTAHSDCGNLDLHEDSYVSIGFLRYELTHGLEASWPPMRHDDPLETRIEDVAQALGRTAAHELGHGIGLVTEADSGSGCNWLNGCDGSHSCAGYQAKHSGVQRFAEGLFIMDPGETTSNHYRIAEGAAGQRSGERHPSTFDNFSRSYISIVEPLQ